MPRPFRSLSPGDSAVHTVRRWITGTFTGRALLTGALIKLVAALLRVFRPESAIVESVDTAGDLALIAGAVLLAYGVFAEGRELFLWRVRSKLTVSYIFIGVVPVLLVIVLFLTTGALLFLNVSQYVARESVRAVVDQAAFLAESAAVGLQSGNAAELRERLMRRQAGAVKAFPYVSYAVVPASRSKWRFSARKCFSHPCHSSQASAKVTRNCIVNPASNPSAREPKASDSRSMLKADWWNMPSTRKWTM